MKRKRRRPASDGEIEHAEHEHHRSSRVWLTRWSLCRWLLLRRALGQVCKAHADDECQFRVVCNSGPPDPFVHHRLSSLHHGGQLAERGAMTVSGSSTDTPVCTMTGSHRRPSLRHASVPTGLSLLCGLVDLRESWVTPKYATWRSTRLAGPASALLSSSIEADNDVAWTLA